MKALTTWLAAVVSRAVAVSAFATPPGKNGRIAFTRYESQRRHSRRQSLVIYLTAKVFRPSPILSGIPASMEGRRLRRRDERRRRLNRPRPLASQRRWSVYGA